MLLNPTLLRRTAMAAAVAAGFPGLALAQTIAKVDFAIGNVTAKGADGRVRPLARGSEVHVGDTVETGKGRVQLRYADGAQMALQPDTEFKIEQFRFSEKGRGGDNVVMSLFRGGLRTITGLIGRSNNANYSLKTPTATIGIRGTEFTAEFRDALRAFCVQGLIFLANGGGNLLLGSGQGAFVSTFTAPPSRDDTKPSLPTISKQEMEILLKVAGVEPQNPQQDFNPVVTLQTALAQLGTPDVPAPTVPPALTGTFTGNWGAVRSVAFVNPLVDTDQQIFLDPGKAMNFVDSVGSQTAASGSASVSVLGNDGIIGWGNWTNGTTSGNHAEFSGRNLTTEGPIHYVVGLPLSSMPTSGLATYNMIGHSASCNGNGCTAATVSNSSLNVDFGAQSVGLAMSLTVNGGASGTYNYVGSPSPLGGAAAVVGNPGRFNLFGVMNGACGSFCNSFQGAGFLSGSGALRAGLVWNGAVGSGSTYVSGATAFAKQ